MNGRILILENSQPTLEAIVQILSDALKRANLSGDTAKDRDALKGALAQTKNMDTVLGKFSFTSGRDADHPPVVQVIKNGNFELFQ